MFEGSNVDHASVSKWGGDKNTPNRLGSVVSMKNMFKDCPFSQYIAYWFRNGPGSVKDMSGMFSGAAAFNQPLGAWRVAQGTDTDRMFAGARAFSSAKPSRG